MSGSPVQSPQVLKVLVVDDDRVNRLRLVGLVRQCGDLAVEADCGETALAIFSEQDIDLVLMDVVMPGISGFEAAATIKQRSQDRWVPVIFLSGLNERDWRDSWIDVGDDYLTKPVDVQLLKARLRSMGMAIFHDRRSSKIASEMAHEQILAKRLMERISQANSTQRFDGIAMRHQAAGISSGDCIVLEGNEESRYVLVADAMGHGLAAAVTLLPAIFVFRAMAQKGYEPHLIAREINLKLRGMLPRERFICAVVAHINRRNQELQLCNCGLPSSLLFCADGQARASFASTAPPLGVMEDRQFDAQSHTLRWQAGDQLLVCTDGFREAFDATSGALMQLITQRCQDGGANGLLQALWDDWSHNRPADDASVVLATLQPLAPNDITPAAPEPARAQILARIFLMPQQLKNSLGADAVLAALARLGLQELESDHKLSVVLSELLANAVDHGVLGLDSRLKEGGMEALDTYFRLREQRLAVLSTGWVALEIRATDQAHILEIDVHDSGAGFDVQRSSGTAGSATGVAPARAGRGLDVLRNLCLRVAHLDGGTRTVATVSLPAMSPNIFKPTGTP